MSAIAMPETPSKKVRVELVVDFFFPMPTLALVLTAFVLTPDYICSLRTQNLNEWRENCPSGYEGCLQQCQNHPKPG